MSLSDHFHSHSESLALDQAIFHVNSLPLSMIDVAVGQTV